MHPGYPIGDTIGGLFGALGVMAALWRRARDPDAPGEEIDLSLTEATLQLLEFLPIEHQQLGAVRQRSGNASQYSAPAAVYRTPTTTGCRCRAAPMRCSPPTAAPSAARPDRRSALRQQRQRVAHALELNALFADWCAAHPLDEVLQAFDAARGTIAPIYDIDQIVADPQMQARERDLPTCPTPTSAACACRPWCRALPTMRARCASGGAIGQDNERFFREELGLPVAEWQRLRAEHIV